MPGKKRQRSSYKPWKKSKQNKPDVWQQDKNNQGWNDFLEIRNEQWEDYYKNNGVCKDEQDFLAMEKAFKTPLPAAIRINPVAPGTSDIIGVCRELAEGDNDNLRPRELKWFDDCLAWQWDSIDRRAIKKHPELKGVKSFMMQHEIRGGLSRQETVSMIPALCMDVQSGHKVLDMCAAPGSKTCQILETLMKKNGRGLVVANEIEWKRANMLSHQVQRLASPASCVVNTDATFFPFHHKGKDGGAESECFSFDRVLCDVPCSGDGTLRKSAEIWATWKSHDGYALHQRQLRILQRGLDLLRPGGRLVYSTCSLNPLEDESVVAGAIARECGDGCTVKCVSLPAELEAQGLIGRQGLTTWPLLQLPEKVTRQKTWDPPADECVQEQLKNCRRFLPQDSNTGGFFVAVLEKSEVPSKPSAVGERLVRVGDDFEPPSDEEWSRINAFYGLVEGEGTCAKEFFVKGKSASKKMYWVSPEALEFLNSRAKSRARVVSVGTRVFSYLDKGGWGNCEWRVAQEGASLLSQVMTRRVVRLGDRTLMEDLLKDRQLSLDRIPKDGLVGVQERDGSEIETGSCIVCFDDVYVACMAGHEQVQLFCDTKEATALLSVVRKDFWDSFQEGAVAASSPEEETASKEDSGETAGGDAE